MGERRRFEDGGGGFFGGALGLLLFVASWYIYTMAVFLFLFHWARCPLRDADGLSNSSLLAAAINSELIQGRNEPYNNRTSRSSLTQGLIVACILRPEISMATFSTARGTTRK
jgi:hypothetical protein